MKRVDEVYELNFKIAKIYEWNEKNLTRYYKNKNDANNYYKVSSPLLNICQMLILFSSKLGRYSNY